MPAKNSKKEYVENGYYHIYNRGVEKRVIFPDEQDYSVFLSYLKQYLIPKDEEELQKKLTNLEISSKERDMTLRLLKLNNFSDEIKLLSYCLMPNHFHFVVNQTREETIDSFMNSFCTRYTMYFNRKYRRVGSLYQGVYKAVLVESDEQLLHLTRYVHKQAIKYKNREQPSSYPEYLGLRKTDWIHPEEILSYFSKHNPSLAYKEFVGQGNDFGPAEKILLEDNHF